LIPPYCEWLYETREREREREREIINWDYERVIKAWNDDDNNKFK
jgi:hypothetical protein